MQYKNISVLRTMLKIFLNLLSHNKKWNFKKGYNDVYSDIERA